MPTIKVSSDCYSELFSAMKKQGYDLDTHKPITIEKDTNLTQPINFKMASMRHACLEAASTAFIPTSNETGYNTQDTPAFLAFAEALFQWTLNGLEAKDTPEQKSKAKTEPAKPTQ